MSESTSTQRPWAAVILAWLVPGAGHLLLGRRGRALIFFAVIAAMVAIGLSLSGELAWPDGAQPMSWLRFVAGVGLGIAFWILKLWVGYEGEILAPGYDYGSAFLLTAGVMNCLLILDAWDLSHGRKE